MITSSGKVTTSEEEREEREKEKKQAGAELCQAQNQLGWTRLG
jgi:hypothetical protein